MSGEDLRDAVIHNRVEVVRQYLIERTNPCSGDEYGLNALHYAVWNGHTECVRLLVMNPNGVDANGRRNTCLITQSCMGYTALHIAALECPQKVIEEIVNVLLIAGSDPKIMDEEGLTAYALAKQSNNQAYLDVFQKYLEFRKGNLSPEENSTYKLLAQVLKSKYVLHAPRDPMTVPKELIAPVPDAKSMKIAAAMTNKKLSTSTGATSTTTSKLKTKPPVDEFALVPPVIAEFINRDNDNNQQRIAERAKDLLVPEEYINPMSHIGFFQMKGVESLKTLKFLTIQAQKNVERREKLVQIGEEVSQQLPSGAGGNEGDGKNTTRPTSKGSMKATSPVKPPNTANSSGTSSLPNIHKK